MKKAKKISKKVSKKVTKVKLTMTSSPAADSFMEVSKLSATEARVAACGWAQDVDGSL